MSRYIKDSAGKLVKFADKFLKMANHIYNEGIYYLRVKADGGTVTDREMVEDIYKVYEENNMLDNIRVGVLAQAGSVQRTSGIYRFFSKLFTLRTDANDVIQSTANSQPYFVNGALVNPNGGSRFMTHPTVSFAANEAWTWSGVVEWNKTNKSTIVDYSTICGNANANNSLITLSFANNRVSLFNSLGAIYSFTRTSLPFIGKKTVIHIVANGNGNLSLYVDGIFLQTLSAVTSFIFNKILGGYTTSYHLEGSLYSHFIRSGALTTSQITAEYTVLRKYFPEIRTTLIGSKEIATENCQMVATPMGRVISLNNTAATWADAQNIYTTTYNSTSGTVEQKTSAALAAAAMWRSPDADHDKQAVFGKVFNKFATKLMAFDIAAYNTANPSTPWGYHVMTRAESLALQALDADTLKATGTDYWTTANGTNTTGLNLFGSGVINADGTYSDFKGKTRLMTDDDYAIDINDDGTATEISVTTEGGILRLVKD